MDLPDTVYAERHVALSSEQTQAYKDMVARLRVEFEAGDVVAVNEAVKLSKLIQIGCGVLKDGDDLYELPVTARVQATVEAIEQSATKAIVFVPFRGALDMLATELRKHFTVAVVDGRTSKTARDGAFRAFQQDPNPRVLLAQPAAMSHGLTLTAASTIVWYAPITNNGTFEQANGRIVRPGQKHKQMIVMIEGSAAERQVYARLRNKQAMQGALLEAVQADRVRT